MGNSVTSNNSIIADILKNHGQAAANDAIHFMQLRDSATKTVVDTIIEKRDYANTRSSLSGYDPKTAENQNTKK